MIIIIIHFLNFNFLHTQLRLDVFPHMKPLHITPNTAHSGCKPSSSLSSFTHSHQVFLPLPAPLTCHHHISTGRHPIISILTFQTPKPPQSTIPPPRSEHPKDVYKNSLLFLSFRDTPHIHLTRYNAAVCLVKMSMQIVEAA